MTTQALELDVKVRCGYNSQPWERNLCEQLGLDWYHSGEWQTMTFDQEQLALIFSFKKVELFGTSLTITIGAA